MFIFSKNLSSRLLVNHKIWSDFPQFFETNSLTEKQIFSTICSLPLNSWIKINENKIVNKISEISKKLIYEYCLGLKNEN